ncbi:DnaD domain-containing protein [Halobacillus karajensis]|uniref:DnaD domain protein n=2 Tax=Halobacillus karajensis TaxID=195088 RepID=A0A059NXT4_9BACI|nr:DnaD domain protein [Halobacillus karajensis]CDQ20327.1 DnaD domain protein [Halobacillus karajensis]CDQ23605.1 DnaD domain protein [Halobacillus karajensis]CDQ27084.1 DnaD domain protein [Halobacillus karajensis]
MQGWVKLHRKILHSEIFENEKMLKVFIYCLTKSSHKDTESRVGRQKVEIEPGQFIFGRKKAASELNMTESTVRDYIRTLEEDGVITVKSTNKYSIVTVDNWALYQSNGEENDNKTTADKHQKDSSSTSERQQKDTYKNERELKEVKNVKEFITTTTSEAMNSESVKFYQNNIGVLSPHISDEIAGWSAEIGDELTIEAMKRSLERNKISWGYVKSILQSWLNKGIKTIEQAEAEEVEHRDRIHHKRQFSKVPSSQEVIPEWFKKRNEQKQNENKKPTIEDTALAIELGIKLKRSRENILEAIHNRYDLSEGDLQAIREGKSSAKEILLNKTNLKVVGDP